MTGFLTSQPKAAGTRRAILRPLLRAAFLAAALAPSASGPLARAAGGLSDAAVEEKIREIRRDLLDRQQADGSWNYGGTDENIGATALALMALRHSGLPRDHAAVTAAAEFIAGQRSRFVYSEGVAPCALELVDPVKYRERIRHSFKFLMAAQTGAGGWGYRGERGYQDNSCSQFAVLGLAAAGRSGLPDNDADARLFAGTRERALRYWRKSQSPGGGWGYRGRGGDTLSMTCAGVASLRLLGEPLERPGKTCGVYLQNKVMRQGLDRLGEILKGGGGRMDGYALYALERVGVLLDLRLIGGRDWYRLGASAILSGRAGKNSWYGVTGSAFRLLFLAKGNAPIAIAKWRWDGDWNNDRGDVRAWVGIAGKELDARFDWWVSRLDGERPPAANASLIFVNGHGRFRASDEELAFLRRFLLRKGTVVAEACCGREEFAESFREVMRTRLFPGHRAGWRPVAAGHPALSTRHDLAPEELGALEFRAGCRKIKMLLVTRDFSCALNGDEGSEGDLERASKAATNLLAWALETRKPRGKLDDKGLEPDPAEVLTLDQLARGGAREGPGCRLAMGRLVHRGEWDVDPGFFAALRKDLSEQAAVPRFERELHVAPASGDLFHVPFLFVTGHEDPALEPDEHLHLRAYLENGGFMLVSNCCSSDAFDAAVRKLVRRVLPNDRLEPVPEADALRRFPHDFSRDPARGTRAFMEKYADGPPPLLGVRRGGRWLVVYSPIDICCALDGDLVDDVPAHDRRSAVRLITNVIHGAFSP